MCSPHRLLGMKYLKYLIKRVMNDLFLCRVMAIPATVIYYTSYDNLRAYFVSKVDPSMKPYTPIVAGAIARCTHPSSFACFSLYRLTAFVICFLSDVIIVSTCTTSLCLNTICCVLQAKAAEESGFPAVNFGGWFESSMKGLVILYRMYRGAKWKNCESWKKSVYN